MSCFGTFWNLAIVTIRGFTNIFLYVIIACYVLTTSVSEAESYIDQAMNFTALLILMELDSIIVGPAFKQLGRQDSLKVLETEDDQVQEVIDVGNQIVHNHKQWSISYVFKTL